MATDSLVAFYDSLEEAPHDRATLSALSDFLEDEGNHRDATCLRWVVEHSHAPFRYRANGGLTVSSRDWHDGWLWWAVDDPRYGRDWGHPRSCMLEPDIWGRLEHSFKYDPAVFKEYKTAREAFEALFDAWARARWTGDSGSGGEQREAVRRDRP
jgi:hypothetical protein